ncbi:hypothetical protein [Aquirufa aurantiipilula]|uniref:Uncharacterized protein n=1 Tax=Aquirufa aurantiipilula TaxID=2696561 RepID=A0ABT6BNW7_9BACT|nr:hypothetical protein [Aquirufa aurantiipilula]MDF5691814.1 hypothetical protein [Aquirufa aurantiipilula]
MKKNENSGFLWALIGLVVFIYTLFQIINTMIDEVFRKNYFKNLSLTESFIYTFFIILLFDVLYLIFVEYVYNSRFPNTDLFSSYFSTLISITISSVIQTFFLSKIFNPDLSLFLFALIINLFFQFYILIDFSKKKSVGLKETFEWNRNLLFKTVVKQFKNSIKISDSASDVNYVYYLLKLPKCNLSIHRNLTTITFRCYKKNLSNEEIDNIQNINSVWVLIFDLKEYEFVLDNFIRLLNDDNSLSNLTTESENTLLRFLIKEIY